MIACEPDRVLPVTLEAALVPRVMAGRVRLIHIPGRDGETAALRLSKGDALWVREGVKIGNTGRAVAFGAGHVGVRYLNDPVMQMRRWPSALARPPLGWLEADRLPLYLSRLTLIVRRVQRIRLQQIDEASALLAGVELDRHGFLNPLQGGCFGAVYDTAHEAFGHFWDCALGSRALGPHAWTCNPEVTQVEFSAVARNITDLVPGLGFGGVR